jgi:cytochrome c-type biogenesis protein CcmE
MKPRTKFLAGGLLILGSAGVLMASSIKETGQYYLTPAELGAKVQADPTFRDNGVKVGARVVPGSIVRDPGGRALTFRMTDGAQTYAVAYRGIAPDTFTDGVDVIVEGRLGSDGTSAPRRCSPSARRATRTRPRSTATPPATSAPPPRRPPAPRSGPRPAVPPARLW